MKMKDIEVGNEYACLYGGTWRRGPSIRYVEGMENFNPYCRKAIVLETGVSRVSGFDYSTGKSKQSKAYVRVQFTNRRGEYDDNNLNKQIVPVRNLVSLWVDYEILLKAYHAALQKERDEANAIVERVEQKLTDAANAVAGALSIDRKNAGGVSFDYSRWLGKDGVDEETHLQNARILIKYEHIEALLEKLGVTVNA